MPEPLATMLKKYWRYLSIRMKKILKYLIVIPIIIFLTECNKEKNLEDYIIVGKNSGQGIFYNDISPNDTLTHLYGNSLNDTVNFDLNGDNVFDFALYIWMSKSMGHDRFNLVFFPTSNTQIAVILDTIKFEDTISYNFLKDIWVGKKYAMPFHYGDTLNINQNWLSDTTTLYFYQWYVDKESVKYGLWYELKDKYLGIRLIKKNEDYYGWLKLELTYWNLILYEYACTKKY